MRTKAAVLYESGKPRPYAESSPLVIEELELDAPGPGEVLVELVGAGLCHSDLSTIDGSRPRPTPMVLGHEASGIVREPEGPMIEIVALRATSIGARSDGWTMFEGPVSKMALYLFCPVAA